MQRSKFIQQEQSLQREKQRQQREAFESTITNHQQNVAPPQSALSWGNTHTVYQNSQGNAQSSIRVYSKPLSFGRAAMLSTYYSKMPQLVHEQYSPYRKLQTNYGSNNVATGYFNRQQSNPEIKEYSMHSPKQNVMESSLHEENNRIPIREQAPLVTVSQPDASTWRRPHLNSVLPNPDQNVTGLSLQPQQHNTNGVHVSYKTTNQIATPGVHANPTNQSQYRISQSNQLQAGNH